MPGNHRVSFRTQRTLRCCIAAALMWAGNAVAALPPAPACPTMIDGFEPPSGGFWTQASPGTEIRVETHGGYTVRIDRHQIIVTDPIGTNKVEYWGDPHENLNGKHIKDWETDRRTLLLGDGTRITLHAQGPQQVVEHTSIYDGQNNLQVDNTNNFVVHASTSLADTLCREREQHDGETARFVTDAATGIARYDNLHIEDDDFVITPTNVPLGTSGGYTNPTQVNDYYDDPRLGHT